LEAPVEKMVIPDVWVSQQDSVCSIEKTQLTFKNAMKWPSGKRLWGWYGYFIYETTNCQV